MGRRKRKRREMHCRGRIQVAIEKIDSMHVWNALWSSDSILCCTIENVVAGIFFILICAFTNHLVQTNTKSVSMKHSRCVFVDVVFLGARFSGVFRLKIWPSNSC